MRDGRLWITGKVTRRIRRDEHRFLLCYVSPFQSTTSTARQPHAVALPLKNFVYGPLRGRRTIRSSRYRSLKVGPSKMPLQS